LQQLTEIAELRLKIHQRDLVIDTIWRGLDQSVLYP
jgi:hypothetical protein